MNLRGSWRDERGATAAEFALLVGPLCLLLFGLMHTCLLLYSVNRLNVATEATARCRATSANAQTGNPAYTGAPCADATATQSYFADMYRGSATATPTINQTGAAPGYCVTASGVDYVINAALFKITVPLSAKACFTQ